MAVGFRNQTNEDFGRARRIYDSACAAHQRSAEVCWTNPHPQHGVDLSRKLKSAMGRSIDSRNHVWNWVAKLHRLAGRYDNPMPIWFLAPIAEHKLPTLRYLLYISDCTARHSSAEVFCTVHLFCESVGTAIPVQFFAARGGSAEVSCTSS